MKHPAILMRGTPTGGHQFFITNKQGGIVLTSRSYEEEEQVRKAAAEVGDAVGAAAGNVIDQLPSTIAHQ